MGRDLFILTKTGVQRYILGKNVRPLAVVRNRLFRVDDALMCYNRDASDSFVMYDLDGTQPYGHGTPLDPDITLATIDVSKSNRKDGTKGILGAVSNINGQTFIYLIVGVVVIWSLLSGGIV